MTHQLTMTLPARDERDPRHPHRFDAVMGLPPMTLDELRALREESVTRGVSMLAIWREIQEMTR